MSAPARATGDSGQATRSRADLTAISKRAVAQFTELTGLAPDAVTGIRPDGDGWSLLIDVTELRRVPATSDVVATYRVDVDGDARITGCERLRRFSRNATD